MAANESNAGQAGSYEHKEIIPPVPSIANARQPRHRMSVSAGENPGNVSTQSASHVPRREFPYYFSLLIRSKTGLLSKECSPQNQLFIFQQYKDFGEARIILNCDPGLEIICDSVKNTYGDSAVFEQLGPHSLPLTAYLVEKVGFLNGSEPFVYSSLTFFVHSQTKGSLWKVESDYLFALEAKDMGMMIGENATTAIHGNITMLFNNQFFHLPPLGLNILTNSLLHRLGNEHTISVVNHPFDYSHQEEAFSFPGFADAFFVAFSVMSGLAFLAASLVISPTVERLSQFKHLQIIAGVRLPIFWTAEILCSSVIFLVGVVMVLLSTDFIVTSELKSFEMKLRCLLLGLAYGAAFIPLAMLVSTYASSAAKAYSQLLALTYVSCKCH